MNDLPTMSIIFRCQACGACSQNVTANCACTDDDRRAVIEAERRALDASLAAIPPDVLKRYAGKRVKPGYFGRVVISGDGP